MNNIKNMVYFSAVLKWSLCRIFFYLKEKIVRNKNNMNNIKENYV